MLKYSFNAKQNIECKGSQNAEQVACPIKVQAVCLRAPAWQRFYIRVCRNYMLLQMLPHTLFDIGMT